MADLIAGLLAGAAFALMAVKILSSIQKWKDRKWDEKQALKDKFFNLRCEIDAQSERFERKYDLLAARLNEHLEATK